MKRLVYLLAVCLSFAAHAELMWQRNNGVWEAVVRVSKEEPVWEIGAFSAVTNGYVLRVFPRVEETNVLWRVDYDVYSMHNDNSIGAERKAYSHFFYATERIYPAPEPMSWTNDMNTIAWHTNHFAEAVLNDDYHIRYDYTAFVVVRTNVVDKTRPPAIVTGELPCRFGVPQTITVDHPYTDLLEMLPLDWPETYTRVRTGFDGYLLIRFDEREMRLTIKRLLPEKLPYEHPRQNIRVLRDDLLYGV